LYITDLARTTGGIAIMADGNVTDEATKGLFIKYVRDKPHVTGYLHPLAVGNGNTGTFLTTVLQGKESEVCKPSYVLTGTINPKNTATLVQGCLSQLSLSSYII
jgi:hypothetical protein